MDLYNLFALASSSLPKTRENGGPFGDYLESIFEEYRISLSELDDTDPSCKAVKDARSTVEKLASGIRDSVDQYLKGFPHAAYDKLRRAILRLGTALDPLLIQGGDDPAMRRYERLYRIRPGKLSSFTRGDSFHVPFQLRHLVTTQRYSIPGLPSLYLSGSIWACWEELRRPDFDSLQISRFRYHLPLKILDFGFRPEYIGRLRGSTLLANEVLVAYAICWPLLAACSVRVYAPGMPFVPEYIVPQLLLQWLRNQKHLDGLRYFSTRIEQQHHDPWAAMNYVFPVQSQAPEGYCSVLQKKFFLTAPCSWSLLTISDFVDVPFNPDNWHIGVNEDRSVPYFNTEFFKCEHKLEGLACKSVAGDEEM
jgi:hypothetical protein